MQATWPCCGWLSCTTSRVARASVDRSTGIWIIPKRSRRKPPHQGRGTRTPHSHYPPARLWQLWFIDRRSCTTSCRTWTHLLILVALILSYRSTPLLRIMNRNGRWEVQIYLFKFNSIINTLFHLMHLKYVWVNTIKGILWHLSSRFWSTIHVNFIWLLFHITFDMYVKYLNFISSYNGVY